MGERNKKILLEQLKLEHNTTCADCGSEEPEWASSNVGVFLCVNCSGIHRMLGTHISRVKSCRLDQWDDESVLFMCENGNNVVNSVLEKYIPPYYIKPNNESPQVLKEQFIHAKYGRKEFTTLDGTQHYEELHRSGNLYKRGKDAKQFRVRRFVLNGEENIIKYFIKPDAKEPKQIIDITKLHVSLAPPVIENQNSLQFSFQTNTLTRHIYLYAETPKEAVDWYFTLRALKYKWLQKTHSDLNREQILLKMERSLKRQGWMLKTGPKKTEAYRKRWFVLDDRKLLYSGSPLDAYPKGEVYLGPGNSGYMVRDGLPPGQDEDSRYGITVTTPERDYLFLCEDQEEQRGWINDIKNIISQPLSKTETSDLDNYKATYQIRRKSMHRIKSPTHWNKQTTNWAI